MNMKSDLAEIKRENNLSSMMSTLSERATASVWLPDYVLRLRQNIHRCDCPGCDGASPLLQFKWKNHTRHSADISCSRAAAEILCPTASCTLIFSEDAVEHLPELPAERLEMNQHCLRLFEFFQADPALLLYTLGCFIRKAASLAPPQRAALLEEWLSPAACRQRVQHFSRQYDNGYPPVVPLQLQPLPLWLLDDSDVRLHKLREMRQMNGDRLQQKWRKLQNASSLRERARQKILSNYLFYELCHNFFPGNLLSEWESNFVSLCRYTLTLNMLLAAVAPESGKEGVSALFAASHRAVRERFFAK